jgi:hypothetical protein
MTTGALLKEPTAYGPVLMSVSAMLLVVGAVVYIASGGVTYGQRTGDEGLLAHLFQWLMTVQVPVAAVFVVKWRRRAPMPTLTVLAIQLAAWLMAVVPLYVLEHSDWLQR